MTVEPFECLNPEGNQSIISLSPYLSISEMFLISISLCFYNAASQRLKFMPLNDNWDFADGLMN